MRRFIFLALLFIGVSSSFAWAPVRYAWGGWNFYPYYYNGAGTVPGSILQGMGAYLAGAGAYRLMAANAGAINTQTWIAWNEYVASVTQVMARRYSERHKAEKARHLKLRYQHYVQLRDYPTQHDVRMGDAINLKVALLAGGSFASKVFEKALIPVTSRFVSHLPLRMASEGLTVSINELGETLQWPYEVQRRTRKESREKVQAMLSEAASLLQDGKISGALAMRLQWAVDHIVHKMEKCSSLAPEARGFLKRLENYAHVYASKDFSDALTAVSSMGDTTLGELLRVMNNYGLSFGEAQNPVEIDANGRLYTVICSVPSLMDRETLESLADYMAAYHY